MKWEYMLMEHTPYDKSIAEERLNKLGKQGWELVTVDDGMRPYCFYFKRLIKQV